MADVTGEHVLKPDQNLCLAEKHAKLSVKDFACVLNSGILLECELILIFMTVYFAKGVSFAFSSGYMIPPRYWEQFIQCAFSMHQQTAIKT